MSRESLLKFIDAVIAGDTEAEVAAFSSYTEDKSKELLCPPAVVPTDASVTESDLGSGITLNGNTVNVDGKKVGVIKYIGTDGLTMTYTDVSGKTFNVKNNDVKDLVRIITHDKKE